MAVNLREEARGRECQIRIPGICNGNRDTVVLCHIHKPSISGGMGLKAKDMLATHGCSACHDVIDYRVPPADTPFMLYEIDIMKYEGVFRTQKILLDEEKIGVL
jgi:hypothetical protein